MYAHVRLSVVVSSAGVLIRPIANPSVYMYGIIAFKKGPAWDAPSNRNVLKCTANFKKIQYLYNSMMDSSFLMRSHYIEDISDFVFRNLETENKK